MGLLQVCCRRANVAPATVWAWVTRQPNACHCFVKLSDGTTLGGYFSYRHFGDLVKNLDDNTDRHKYAPEAKCTDLPGVCDGRALRAYNAIPDDIGPYGVGPGSAGTSNAVALTILQNAGYNWKAPACAWGPTATPPQPYLGPIYGGE
jgi:hypothetical protein